MSNEQKPTYAVGYGKPPVEGRFKTGRSGNPKGRPRKQEPARIRFGDGHAGRVFETASLRSLNLTEGGRPTTMSAAEALIRSLQAQAMKGNRLSAQMLLKDMRKADKKAARTQAEDYRFWVDYKALKTAEIAQAKKAGLTPPHPYPHPSDIIVDGPNFMVHFIGPMNKECSARFEHQRLQCEIFLGMAEQDDRRRRKGSRDPLSVFAVLAHLIHEMQPPSYGGGDATMLIHMCMEWQNLGLRAIGRRLVQLRHEVAALPPLDVPDWLAARKDRIKNSTRALAIFGDTLTVMADAMEGGAVPDEAFIADALRAALRAHPVEKD